MKTKITVVLVLVLMVTAFGILWADQARPAAGDQGTANAIDVKIENFSFTPPTVTVPAGTKVTWTNQDDVPHTVVSSQGKTLKSSVLDTGEKFSYTFTTPGTYSYYCSVHPMMTAKVVVK